MKLSRNEIARSLCRYSDTGEPVSRSLRLLYKARVAAVFVVVFGAAYLWRLLRSCRRLVELGEIRFSLLRFSRLYHFA